MTKLGEITYNALESGISQYPQLKQGYIQFNFSTSDETYTMIIFYNQMAGMLFFSIYDSNNNAIQINQPLAEYPQNVLYDLAFNDCFMYFKNNVVYFGNSNEAVLL